MFPLLKFDDRLDEEEDEDCEGIINEAEPAPPPENGVVGICPFKYPPPPLLLLLVFTFIFIALFTPTEPPAPLVLLQLLLSIVIGCDLTLINLKLGGDGLLFLLLFHRLDWWSLVFS